MSQYKVLPSYTDLTSLPDIHQLPVIFSAGVGQDDSGLQVTKINDRTMLTLVSHNLSRYFDCKKIEGE